MFSALSIQGIVALPDSPEYTFSLSRVYNRQCLVDNHPLAVVIVSGTRDIVQTIAFCKSHKLSFSILGGGVNPTGAAVSGKVVLDLRLLSFVYVCHESGSAIVGSGLTFKQLDYELELHGVCVAGPLFSKVGVAGAFLGGGEALVPFF
jgi:FAD/FMN-containing dehydrogenase